MEDRVEVGVGRDRVVVDEAEERALADLHAVEPTSRDATVISPVATERERVEHRALVLSGELVGRNATIAASPACTDVDGTTRTSFSLSCGGLLCGQDHVGVVRKDEHVVRRSASIAARMSAADGFIDWPPSMTVSRRGSRTGGGCPGPDTRRRGPSGASANARGRLLGQASLARPRSDGACSRSRRPRRRRGALPAASAASGIIGVHVDFQRGRVTDDQERVAELRERRLEGVRIELEALDDGPVQ